MMLKVNFSYVERVASHGHLHLTLKNDM